MPPRLVDVVLHATPEVAYASCDYVRVHGAVVERVLPDVIRKIWWNPQAAPADPPDGSVTRVHVPIDPALLDTGEWINARAAAAQPPPAHDPFPPAPNRPDQRPDQRRDQRPDQRRDQRPDQRRDQRPDQRRDQRRDQRPDQRRDQRRDQCRDQRPDEHRGSRRRGRQADQ
jgi:hypothetical protein